MDFSNTPDALLIISIIKQAIVDIMNCPSANPDPCMKYKKSSARYDSADAKRFIHKDNTQFQYYCHLLGWNPEYVEEQCYKYIRKYPRLPKICRKQKDDLFQMRSAA